MAGEHVPITVEFVEHALMLDDIDKLGLDKDDRALLWTLCKGQKRGPIGLENLAASCGLDTKTVTEATNRR